VPRKNEDVVKYSVG